MGPIGEADGGTAHPGATPFGDVALTALRDVAIQGYDTERRVFYWNDASRILYGYTATEAVGRRLEDLILPDEIRDAAIDEIRAWISGGPPPSGGTLDLKRKDGSPVRVCSNHLSLRDEDGRLRLFCIDVPIEQQVALEATLAALWALGEAKGTVVGPAIGAAAHGDMFGAGSGQDVRTPLTAIVAFSRRLAMRPPADAQALGGPDGFETVSIRPDVARAVRQNLALLGAAPLDLDPHSRRVPVQDVLVEAAGLLLDTGADHYERVAVVAAPPDWTAFADPFLLKQALGALGHYGLHNGLGPRSVMLSARVRHGVSDGILFFVEDGGPPVPDALRLRLLSAHPVPADSYHAVDPSGLAYLSMVQRMALATGASLSFEQTPAGNNRAVLGVPAMPP